MAEGEEIDSLLVRLGLESDEKEFQQADAMFSRLKSTALQFGAVIGGGLGVRELTFGFSEATEEMGRFASRLSVPVEFVDALGFAFEQIGGDAGEAFSSIEKIANLIEDTEWGELPSDAFRVAGFDPMLFQGIETGAEAYERLSDAVRNMNPEQARRALKAIGMGDSEIDLFTGTGSESFRSLIEEGLDISVINDEMVQQGKDFNRSVGTLSKTIEGFSREFSSMFIDDLTAAINELIGFIRSNEGEIKDLLKTALNHLDNIARATAVVGVYYSTIKGKEFLSNLKSGKVSIPGLITGGIALAASDDEIYERSVRPLLETLGLVDERAPKESGGPGLKFDPDRPPDLPPMISPDTPVSQSSSRNVTNHINVDARGSNNPAEVERASRRGVEAVINELAENSIRDLEGSVR